MNESWLPVLLAVLPAVVGAFLTRGGTEGRLLRRAGQALELASKVRGRAVRASLYEAAEDDIARALKLRESGRALWVSGLLGAGAWAATLWGIPWYIDRTPAAQAGWTGLMWLALWFVYFLLAAALTIAFLRVWTARSKVVDG